MNYPSVIRRLTMPMRCLALTLCFLGSVLAQERVIDNAELNRIRRKAEMGMREVSHRIITTTETFRGRDGKATDGSVATNEFVPPDRRHIIFEIRPPWSPVTKDESILIGDARYAKNANGTWDLTTQAPRPWPLFDFTPLMAVIKFIETMTLNGEKVDVYESVNTTETRSTLPTKTTDTSRYWVRADGLYAKKMKESDNPERKVFSRQTSVYEYIPKLKIEAPTVGVMKPKQP